MRSFLKRRKAPKPNSRPFCAFSSRIETAVVSGPLSGCGDWQNKHCLGLSREAGPKIGKLFRFMHESSLTPIHSPHGGGLNLFLFASVPCLTCLVLAWVFCLCRRAEVTRAIRCRLGSTWSFLGPLSYPLCARHQPSGKHMLTATSH